jgi:hypothetical protein
MGVEVAVTAGRTGVELGATNARAVGAGDGGGATVAPAAGDTSCTVLEGDSRRPEASGAGGAIFCGVDLNTEGCSAGVALATGAGIAAAVLAGFTKVREGAFGGGVASLFILRRACSTACRSPIRSQP